MSFKPLSISFDFEGLSLLEDILINAPDAVTAAAERAALQAVPLLSGAIAQETPVRTGFLQSNTNVAFFSPLSVVYANATPYASFVERRTGFVERGVADVEAQVEAIFEAAIDQVAESFSRA